MMKKITLLIAILTFSLGYAQTLPFDFSDAGHLMTGADGATTSIVQDNGEDVLQIVGAGGAWDNAQIDFAENLDLSDDDGRTGVDTVTMSFLLSGIDSEGKTAHVARQLLLQGETLYALDPFYPLISESEVTVNHASLEAGDNLNIVLTLSKTKSDLADIYIAIQLPDESFVTLSREPFSISLINQVIPFVSGTSHSGEIVYPVINTTLPSDIASGNYKVFAIVTEAGANVLEPSNWASITEQSFLIN